MEESSRRSFLLAVLGMGVTGCAGRASSLITDEDRAYLASLEEENRRIKASEAADKFTPEGIDIRPLPRSAWAPSPPIKTRLKAMHRISRITVHHEGSDVNMDTSRSSVASDLQDIRRIHLSSMRAGDIGYHYIIDRSGRVWQGRPITYQGAHAGGSANRENLGVMLLGNFDIQRPSEKQLLTLKYFLADRMKSYSVPVSRLYTHQELKATRCPGRHLQAYMDRYRRNV